MARTYRNLWQDVVSWENMVAAYHRCRKRKRSKPEAVEFDFAWEAELVRLRRELCEGRYQPGQYRNFYIHEPKRRKISAAPFRDRVVHHAVVRVLERIYEPRFVHDSYACRGHKGTHRAIIRAQYYLRRHTFYLKTDLVRFFPNVDHAVLLELISRRIRDQRLLDLLRVIIRSGEGVLEEEATHGLFPGDDLFALARPTGLPIGNLTSQFFANVLLDPIDHFIKEELGVPGYVRYADDLVLFGEDKQTLRQWLQQSKDRMALLRLRLHDNKTQISPAYEGLKFLGFVLKGNSRRLQQTSIVRFNRRLRRWRWLWKHHEIKPEWISLSLNAMLVHARFANTHGLLRDVCPRVRFIRRKGL